MWAPDKVGNLIKASNGSTDKAVIAIPGFFSATSVKFTLDKWSEALRNAGCKDTIYVFAWNSGDLFNLIQGILPKLVLLKNFGLSLLGVLLRIKIEAERVIKNAKSQSHEFAADVIGLSQYFSRMSVYSYSFGTRVYYYSCKYLPNEIFENAVTLAGASEVTWKFWGAASKKAKKHINVYSKNDMVLKMIYKMPALGVGRDPIGLRAIKRRGVINRDLTKYISGHLDYLPNSKHWYKERWYKPKLKS